MTNFKRVVGAAVALLALPLAACARPADPQAPATDKSQPAAAGMTLQEFVSRNERRLMAADTDGDGKISQAEFMAAAKSGRGDPAKRFARWDRNGDGVLDRAEIEAMLTRRFRHLDANGDGVLTPEEQAAGRGDQGAKAVDGSAP